MDSRIVPELPEGNIPPKIRIETRKNQLEDTSKVLREAQEAQEEDPKETPQETLQKDQQPEATRGSKVGNIIQYFNSISKGG